LTYQAVLYYYKSYIKQNRFWTTNNESLVMSDMLELSIVSSKGQVTIPANMREKYGIKAGDRIVWEDFKDKLAIRKPPDFFSQGGSLHLGTIPDNEEDLLTPEMGQHMTERE
jgi:AbrB family looped-hinge helix DNA binding protein